MDHAVSDDDVGEDRLDRLGESGQPVDAADQDVAHTATLRSAPACIQNLAPSVSWNHIPSTSRSPSSVTPSARYSARRWTLAALADLDDHAVQEHDRVDVLQRPLSPFAHVVHDRVGDLRDQLPANLHRIDLLQMRLDIPHREPAAVQRQDLLVKPDWNRRWRLRTILGSKLPCRSRGAWIATLPCSQINVFGRRAVALVRGPRQAARRAAGRPHARSARPPSPAPPAAWSSAANSRPARRSPPRSRRRRAARRSPHR